MSDLLEISRAYKNEQSEASLLPAIYVIEPTNSCNIDCIMCPNRLYADTGMMSLDVFRAIIDQIHGYAKVIMLYFVGEPLIHPEIADMIRYCKDNTTAKIILSTNGMLLEGETAESILTSGLDELIICIEGATAHTHEQIRRGSDFARVVDNAEHFIQRANRQGKPDCVVQMIRMHMNEGEVESFKARWAKYDCTVMTTWLATWASQFPGMMRLSDDLCPNKDQRRMPCAEIWYKMVINHKGDVVLCCLDWANRVTLGNVATATVSEIWNSPRIKQIRELHQRRQFGNLSLCKNCFEWSTEEEILEYLKDADQRKTWFV